MSLIIALSFRTSGHSYRAGAIIDHHAPGIRLDALIQSKPLAASIRPSAMA
jgi:hypothetical protein